MNARDEITGAAIEAVHTNELIDMIGGRLERVARMGEGDGDTVLFRTQMAPGQLVPLHSHADPECFYVLAGQLEVFLLDAAPRWRALPAGRSVLVANGIRHAVRNAASEAADLVVATNNRLARFFRACGRPAQPGTDFTPAGPEGIARVVRTAKTYGYWLSSPEEHAALTATPDQAAGRRDDTQPRGHAGSAASQVSEDR